MGEICANFFWLSLVCVTLRELLTIEGFGEHRTSKKGI